MTAIKIENLTKDFGKKKAVDGISLSIESGELFALLGVNGAGKTTTIKMLCGLLSPSSGEAEIFDSSIKRDMQKIKEIIALSPQESAVAPNLSVYENLEFMASLRFEKSEVKKKCESIMEKLSLREVRSIKAKKLSGGFERRLSIALALICEPKILFLDEPTLGLDVLSRRELWKLIEGLKGKTTVILTTHYLEEAEALSDRLCIMKDGKILRVGTAEEISASVGLEKFEDAFVKLVEEAER